MNRIKGWDLIPKAERPVKEPEEKPAEVTPEEEPAQDDKISIFMCQDVGVDGTTEVHVQEKDGVFEARIGFALFGSTMMTEEEFEACDCNPFHENFRDNFASGEGATKEEAIEAMKKNLSSVSASLFH